MSTVERLPKSLSAFFCRPLTLQQNLMWVTVLKPTVHRAVEYGLKIPVRYHFQWRKTTASWLLRTTWKKEFDSKVPHSLKTAKWNEESLLF